MRASKEIKEVKDKKDRKDKKDIKPRKLASKKVCKEILNYFRENVPVAESELNFNNPFELIVAVILSAQCTDKRVNEYTPQFFKRFPNAESLSIAEIEEVYSLIKSISFPNNKAKHLIGMAKMVVNDFNGEIPGSVAELERLPGVSTVSPTPPMSPT